MIFKIGDIHNNHKILDYIKFKNNKNYYYKFYVACLLCGNLKFVQTGNFKHVSCKNGPCHMNFINLTGRKIGNIDILEYLLWNGKWKWRYKCNLCEGIFYSKASHFLQAKQNACKKCTIQKIATNRILPNKGSAFNRVYRNYKRNAKNKGLEFNLSKIDFESLITKNCIYCNAIPKVDSEGYVRNGIDKIDPNIGYIIGNVVPCCNRCNSAKSDMSIVEFEGWILKVYNTFTKNGKILKEYTFDEVRKNSER